MSNEIQGFVSESDRVEGGLSTGDTDVLIAITNYIKGLDLPNAYDAKGSAEEVKTLLEQYKTSNDSVVSEIANNVLGILNGENISSFGDVESALMNYVTSDSFKLSIDTLAASIGTIPDGAASDNVADYVKELVDAEDNKIQLAFDGLVNSINAYIESNNEKVDRNALAITDMKDGESIDSFKDVENALAKKQPTGNYATKEEAKGYADAKDVAIAEAKQIGIDNSDSINKLTSDLTNVNNNKADKADLAKTNLYLDALYKLNKGQTYDVLEQESEAYSVDVPSGAKYVGIDKVGGKSVAWNQQVIPEKRNNAITPDGSVTYSAIGMSFSSVINHVYLCSADIVYDGDKNPLRAYCSLGSDNYGFPVIDITHTGTTHCEWLAKRISGTSQTQFGLSNITTSEKLTSEDAWECNNSMMIDLTQMFGSTIADYIYSLEKTTAGAGVAWFKKLFPADYYPYSEPTIISSQTDRADVATADGTISQQITTGFPTLNSAGSVYDYIDLNEGKLHQRVGVVDLGSLDWSVDDYGNLISILNDATRGVINTMPNILASEFQTIIYENRGNYTNPIITLINDSTKLYVKNSGFTDPTTFKSAMSGVMLVYELAEEIITDITIPTELTDWLTVEAGGSITFHNADEGKRLLIPNKLSFVRKLDEVTV